MYQITDRLYDTFRVQRYEKYMIYANKIDKKNRGESRDTEKIQHDRHAHSHTTTLPHKKMGRILAHFKKK